MPKLSKKELKARGEEIGRAKARKKTTSSAWQSGPLGKLGPGNLGPMGEHWPFVMPWGRHKGRPFTEIPTDDLEWILTASLSSTFVKDSIARELAARKA